MAVFPGDQPPRRGDGRILWLAVLLVLAVFARGDAAADDRLHAQAAVLIVSVPSGASVSLDGRPAGLTPLQLSDLTPGEHRLALLKDGYLENGRRVWLEGGQGRVLSVQLTAGAQTAAAPAEPAASTGGGVPKKALFIGLGAAAALGAIVALAGGESNEAPVAAVTTDLEGQALLGATNVGFSGTGSMDANGDSLTYSWNFGDGAAATGASVTHVFDQPGTFEVTLTASDGELTSTATDSVSVRGLNGAWRGTFAGDFGAGIWNFFHTGSTVTGTRGTSGSTSPFSGTVEHPRRVKLSSPGNLEAGLCPFELEVEANTAISTMAGTLTLTGRGCGTAVFAATFVRF